MKVVVRYLDGSVKEEHRCIDPEVLRAIRNTVYCPGGFRIEFGLSGQYVVCYDAFRVSQKQGVELEEIGYYREKIS